MVSGSGSDHSARNAAPSGRVAMVSGYGSGQAARSVAEP
jgi:hypothetical protein